MEGFTTDFFVLRLQSNRFKSPHCNTVEEKIIKFKSNSSSSFSFYYSLKKVAAYNVFNYGCLNNMTLSSNGESPLKTHSPSQ